MSSTPQGKFQLSEKKKAILDALLSKEGMAPVQNRIPRREGSGPAPLSFSQQRLWFFDQFEPGNFVYNLLTAVSLRGKLDVPALQKAFNELVRRHESLRTTFEIQEGQPVQIIGTQQSIPMRHLDLTELPEAEQQSALRRLLDEQSLQPFDLKKGPLLRITLVRQSQEEHVVLMAMHHIVTDGWSMNILVQETIALYEAYSSGRAPDLPPLPLQYADFAVWQRNWLQGEILAQQLEFWKRELGDHPAVLELPADRPRPAVQTYHGADFTFAFSPALSQALKALCRDEEATLSMALLAGFKVLLHRYTGQQEIIVGSPIANRQRKEIEGLIGFFVNTLAIRTMISGEMSFRELLKKVKEAALGAYAHQDLPFEYLVEQFQPERSLSHSPLVQVIFNFRAAAQKKATIPGLSAIILNTENQSAKFDLTLFASDQGHEISGTIEYNVDLFNRDTIERMANHLLTLFSAIVADPERHISELSLLTRHERYQMLTEWNATDAPYPRLCAQQLFEAQAQRTPNATALVLENQELTYGQLNARANQLARYLASLGCGAGKFAGIFMERSLETIIAVLGILKSGAACLPLDPAYPKERLAFMLEDSGCDIAVSQRHLTAGFPGSGTQLVCMDSDWERISQEQADDLQIVPAPESWMYAIYTSGSTGRPKSIAVPHRVLVNMLAWQEKATRQAKRTLQFASLNFDVSYQEIFSTLGSGGTLVLVPESIRADIPALGRYVEQHKVERFHLPPVVLQKLAEEFGDKAETLASVREFMAGGEQLQISASMRRLFGQLKDCVVYNHYGPSETHIVTSFALPREVEHWPALPPLGRPVNNTSVFLLDPYMQPVPIGLPAELYFGGACVAHGYLKRPDLTAERFIPDPFSNKPGARMYKTGDLARYLADGNIEFLGRNDFQVKIRGMRIELGEIEVELKRHPAVRDAVVVLAKEDQESRLIGYVVFQPGRAVTSKEMREFLHERLPEHMLPSVLVSLEDFPLTPSGKVDRRALPAPGKPQPGEHYVAPKTDLEQVLAAVFSEVLRVDRIGVFDNFFELGGHSLLATQISSRVRECLQVELPVRKIFEEPTISGLARAMIESGTGGRWVERNASLFLQLALASEDDDLPAVESGRESDS
jgi:amino acid adenylation domain-containing protein